MLVEKEVIRPGTYWYKDEASGEPKKLTVTPELTKYWLEQGNAMLSAGLTVPVPFEHDFNAHPMTPAEKLLNNSGWVKEYKLTDGNGGPGDRLFSVVDIQDADVAKKLPGTIRWTSPWINSFTDGMGKEWKNVISHLALTTRPRIVEQAPFSGVAAALSLATPINSWAEAGSKGVCLSIAGQLNDDGQPTYPEAFSLLSNGIGAVDAALAFGAPPPKAKKPPIPEGEPDADDGMDLEGVGDQGGDESVPDDGDPSNDDTIDLEPFNDPAGDVSTMEVLCDLLGALGIHCDQSGDEANFKRALYNAAMTKIHELTANGEGKDAEKDPNRTNPPGQPPNNQRPPGTPGAPPNPLIQQEQQPMFMSLGDIQKIADPTMKTIALSMYQENVKLRAKLDEGAKTANGLRDAKLKEESAKRTQRVMLLSRLSPRLKGDLDAMLALPSMALSMGDGGVVVDPMAQTLAMLEKGLSDLPRMLTSDASMFSVQAQPTDADALTEQRADDIADSFARQMGCAPTKRAS